MLSMCGRAAVFGADHFEVDMQGAFYELFRCLLDCTNLLDSSLSIGLPPLHEVRLMLHTQLGATPYARRHPDFVKRLPSIALNIPMAQTLRTIRWFNFFIPDPVRAWLQQIEHGKTIVLPELVRRGFDRDRSRITDRNVFFYHIEAFEAAYMRQLIGTLLSVWTPQSLVWIHDGFLVCPCIPEHILRWANGTAAQRMQVPPVFLQVTSLLEQHEQVRQECGLTTECPYQSPGLSNSAVLYHPSASMVGIDMEAVMQVERRANMRQRRRR